MNNCTRLIISALLALPLSLSAADETAVEARTAIAPDSLLLVFTSGVPCATATDIQDPAALDAISTATSKDRGTIPIAGILAERLAAGGVKVRLARAEEFSKNNVAELDNYRTIVVGSPTRMGNYAWEMKRFLDLALIGNYLLKQPEKARTKRFALFTTAAGERGATSLMTVMEKDFKSYAVVARQTFCDRQSGEQFQAALDSFYTAIDSTAKAGE
ncbi:hypothetical protein LLH00_04145 [bacterium]|nr:hypothetical protein [bacterium]